MQADFRRLMSEIEATNEVVFSITDQKLDGMFFSRFKDKLDYKDQYYVLSLEDFEDFQDFLFNNGFSLEDDVNIVSGLGETSVTGAGEAYLPGLNVPAKKYKSGYTEELNETSNPQSGKATPYGSGYKEVKGFRAGHTKDTGGFQYKDLWNVNEEEDQKEEEFKIGDKVEIIGMFPDKSYGVVISFDDDLVAVNMTKGGGSTFKRELMIPRKKLKLQNSELKKKDIEMEKEPIKEGLKTDIKLRSKRQQFQEAVKLVNRKLKEVNSVIEYVSEIKSGLNESNSDFSLKAVESMKKNLAEAYKKIKSL
jgi:hypothetical protein